MIRVHRLSGDAVFLNADLIETVEATPDTVISLVDGRRLLVQESPGDVIDAVRTFRASLLAAADKLRTAPPAGQRSLTLVSDDDEGRVDVMLLAGLAVAVLGIASAMLIDGNALGPLLGLSALVLVILTTLGASVMSYRSSELRRVPRSLPKVVSAQEPDLQAVITRLARFADVARRDGMLALEAELDDDDDHFVRLGVTLLVDGADEDVVRETLQIEIAAADERHRTPIDFFRTMASYAPTFGMIGTIIGLINMLGNLQEPELLGIGMALALLTTLYGVLFANLICNPIANRLERLNQLELSALDITFDGLLTVHRGAPPRAVVERLESYLAPAERLGMHERLEIGRARADAAASDEAA